MSRLRPLVTTALTATVAGAVGMTSLWLGQRHIVFVPDRSAPPPAAAILAGAADVTLTTSDGLRLGGWLVPAATAVDRRVAVLVTQGNGGNRTGRAPLAAALAANGFTVLLFDYRGYGGNEGSPSEEGLGLDARAAYSYLTGSAGFTADRVLFLGESLGAAVATELATAHPPAGLVLRSPFDSLAAVAGHHFPFLPVRMMLRDRFPVSEHLATLDVPTVVVYGDRDTVVPPENSLRAAAAARDARVVLVAGTKHNDQRLAHGQPLIDAVLSLSPR